MEKKEKKGYKSALEDTQRFYVRPFVLSLKLILKS
jgi:hypothetical protein